MFVVQHPRHLNSVPRPPDSLTPTPEVLTPEASLDPHLPSEEVHLWLPAADNEGAGRLLQHPGDLTLLSDQDCGTFLIYIFYLTSRIGAKSLTDPMHVIGTTIISECINLLK